VATVAEAPGYGSALDARALFNPGFVALLIARAAAGHERDYERPLTLTLAFLVAPLVVHTPTRRSLPSLNGRLANWADANPLLRAELAVRAPTLTPVTRRAIRFGARYGFIEFVGSGVLPGDHLPAVSDPRTADVDECLRAAERLGRWLPRAGSVTTVYALLGVRP
jgi:hypothetical protein